MLVQTLLNFTLLGAEWVLWLMIVVSVLSIAVMIERALVLRANRFAGENVIRDLNEALAKNDVERARRVLEAAPSIETEVVLAGLHEAARGVGAVEETLAAAAERARARLERRLIFLGTVGSNAPFVGLFGTVLGIIKAFRDLSLNTQEGSAAVMAGISEALVATAIGLLVAIPAVVAFNYFSRAVKGVMTNTSTLSHVLLAWMKSDTRTALSTPR